VTQQTYQSSLARLVFDSDFATRVASESDALAEYGLDDLEARRVQAYAADPRLRIVRKLHEGFRLGKIVAFLPQTCSELGAARLTEQLAIFWRRPPVTLYFVPEARAFCDHLLASPSLAEDEDLRRAVLSERSILSQEPGS
jgi:hypothetical protein